MIEVRANHEWKGDSMNDPDSLVCGFTIAVGDKVRVRGFLTELRVVAIYKPANSPQWGYLTQTPDGRECVYTLDRLERVSA